MDVSFQSFKERFNSKLNELEKDGQASASIVRRVNRKEVRETRLLDKYTFKVLIHYQLYKIFGTSGTWYKRDRNGEFKRNDKGELEEVKQRWAEIFQEIVKYAGISDKLPDSEDGRQRFTDLNKGESDTNIAIACYYWMHTFNEDIGKGEFPFRKNAHEIDEIFFGQKLDVGSSKGIGKNSEKNPPIEIDADSKDEQIATQEEILSATGNAQKNTPEAIKTSLNQAPEEQSLKQRDIVGSIREILKRLAKLINFSLNKFEEKRTVGFVIKDLNRSYVIRVGRANRRLKIPKPRKLDTKSSFLFLDWQQSFVQLHGREEELKTLHEWLDDEILNRSILLIHGSGGVGKTRLAFHFAGEASEKGWEAGRTDNDDLIGKWVVGRKGLLLIIDYVEERYESVKKLLKAVENFDECDTTKLKLRILVLSRNEKYAEELTKDANRRVNSIYLEPFKSPEVPWKIFKNAWDSLNKVSIEEGYVDKSGNLPNFDNFSEWYQKDIANKNPLFSIALAIYTYENNIVNSLLSIRSGHLTRHLTKREVRIIQNEILEYNKLQKNHDFIDYEATLLLKAVANISGGLDKVKIDILKKRLSEKVIYPIPEIRCLTRLSLWKNNQIEPVQPDILAADFIEYCFENWAGEDAGLWLLPPILN